eukprot:2323523-Amphidinium_carterae.2
MRFPRTNDLRLSRFPGFFSGLAGSDLKSASVFSARLRTYMSGDCLSQRQRGSPGVSERCCSTSNLSVQLSLCEVQGVLARAADN